MADENNVLYILGQINGKQDMILQQLSDQRRAHEGLEGRVRKIEGFQKYILGMTAAISALVSTALPFIVRKF